MSLKKKKDETSTEREARLKKQRLAETRLKKEKQIKKIGAVVRKMKQKQVSLAPSASTKAVASPPNTPNYHGETGVVLLSHAVLRHFDDKVRRLAGQYVKVLPETAETFVVKGVKKVRVGVIPLDLPNPEQVFLSLDFIRSGDPIVNGLRTQGMRYAV
ncbi:MAG: hypothetical protein V1801_02275 [Candidatus Falkowbacteria bacterium]